MPPSSSGAVCTKEGAEDIDESSSSSSINSIGLLLMRGIGLFELVALKLAPLNASWAFFTIPPGRLLTRLTHPFEPPAFRFSSKKLVFPNKPDRFG